MNKLSIAAQLRILVALALVGVFLVLLIGGVAVTSALSNQRLLQAEVRPLDEAGRTIAESLDGFSQLRGGMLGAESVEALQQIEPADPYRDRFAEQIAVIADAALFTARYGDDLSVLRERFSAFTESFERIRPELETALSQREDLVRQVRGIVEFFAVVESDIEGLFKEALDDYERRRWAAPIAQVDHSARAWARAIEVSRAMRDVLEAQTLDELERIHTEDLEPAFSALTDHLESFEAVTGGGMARSARDMQAALGAFDAWMFAEQGSVMVAKEREVAAAERIAERVAENERHHEALWEAAGRFAERVDAVVNDRMAIAEAQARRDLLLFIGAGVLVGIMMAGPLYWVSRRLHSRIARLRDEVGAMRIDRSTIDLSRPLTVTGLDELSSLAGSFNEVLDTVRDALREVVGAVQAVDDQAAQIGESTQRSRDMARTQGEQTDQIATAMNQMASTVQEVSSNTQVAHQHTTQAAEQGLEIREIAESGVQEMGRLSTTMEGSKAVVDRLVERSTEVGKMTANIQEIADQTNLLSLNAAIEAARAGDEGRGFAVVAEEVRTLAINTQEMTQQIHKVIAGLQQDAAESAETIHQGREQAIRSAEEVERIKAAVENVHNALSGLEDQVSHIASAAEEQSATAEEINRNVQGLNDLASENSYLIDKLSRGGESLREVAERLQQHSRRFRL
ncbi:methyl-accepting chemotaxis protein [Halorhodospira abdelmalekii]|uniref:methyl-accepting chemotaxis protein n=1 Tax=Halorhodospira abdelmalekii TaxID=421629 RepID=UPI0019089E30|nr:methyl-accepting chemotaxis protein [Halorhodospira abdelmalekii]